MGDEAKKAVRKARKRQKKSDKAREKAGLPMRPELFKQDNTPKVKIKGRGERGANRRMKKMLKASPSKAKKLAKKKRY